MTIPTWNRTQAEFGAPFASGEAAGLELARHTLRTLPDPYLAAYEQDGDLQRYAEQISDFFEAAFGPSLWAALAPDRDAAAVATGFGRRLRKAIEADPRAAACSWHVVVLEIVKP